jgi:hypothetical protein
LRRVLLVLAGIALVARPVAAQSADEIVGKYLKAIGGTEAIQAVKTLRRSGRYIGSGGFEARVVQENKRDHRVREEFLWQNMIGVNAYDGEKGWKIEPWQGKKDPEPLSEEEMKTILEDSDFDGPLIDYRKKGNKVEFAGMDDVEGTDVFKLKVTLPGSTVFLYFIDTDSNVPIKIETHRMVRGAERDYETTLADYKKVAGWYQPHSIETNVKGSPDKSTVVYDKIDANLEIDDSHFRVPAATGAKEPKP